MKVHYQNPRCARIWHLFVVTFSLTVAAAAQSETPPQRYGTYEITLPSGWQYDPGGSAGEFHTFNYLTGGKTGYVVRLKKIPFDCPVKKDFNREMVKIFYDFYGRQDYVDKFKDNSDYGALGEQESHLITFNLKESNERGFLLSPWVGGKMYSIYIYDKTSQKKELRPEAVAFLGALKVHPGGVPAEERVALAALHTGKSAGNASGNAQSNQSSQNIPDQGLGSHEGQIASGKTQASQSGQTVPGQKEGSQSGQSAPDQKEGSPGGQNKTGNVEGGQGSVNASGKTPGNQGGQGSVNASGKTPGNQGGQGSVNASGKTPGNQGGQAFPGKQPAGSGKATAGSVRPPLLPDLGRMPFASEIDFATMTSAQYTGAISMAREGMRLVYGEMTAQEERQFEKEWQPLFDFPCKEVVEYVNRLNPLISEFLALREALGSEIEAYNAAALVVTIEAAEEDSAGMAETMAELELTVATINALQKQMDGVAAEIAKLGDLPDAAALAEGQRKLHRKALGLLAGNNFPFEGEWETADGSNLLMRVLKVFDDGKVLVYRFPISTLEKWEANGVDITKPGVEFNDQSKGLTLIPGVYDLLIMFEPLEDGAWGVLDWSFFRFVNIYRGDKDTINVLQYRVPNELNNTSGVSTYTLSRTKESYPVPPVLPIDGNPAKWDQLLEVVRARKWDQEKYDFYLKWRKDFPDELGLAARGGPTPLEERTRLYLEEKKKIEEEYQARLNSDLDAQVNQNVSLRYSMMYLQTEKLTEADRPRIIKEERQKLLESFEYTRNSQLEFIRNKYADIFKPVPEDQKPKPQVSQELVDHLKALKEWETAEAVRKQQEEQVKFHENNIRYFDGNIEKLQSRLAVAGMDPHTRNDLTRDLLYQMDARQKENDAIMTLKTGEYVHTRTELDALNMQMMAERGRQMAEEAHQIKRTMERMPKLIELAEPSERIRLRQFFERNMVSADNGAFDPARMRQAARAVGEQVSGELEKKAAEKEEWAAAVTGMVEGLEYVKTGADVSMTLLSIAAPVYFAHTAPNAIAASMRAAQAARVFFGYQGVSGYLEGGPAGAFTRVASSYNTVTMMANAAMNGYQQGVLQHLEAHAANAATTTLDENKAGLWGAGWELGKEALKTVVFKAALGALMPAQPKGAPVQWSEGVDARGNPIASPSGRWPTVQQQVQAARFLSRQAEGRAKVTLFRERMQKLSDAGKAGAPKEEIAQLRSSAEEAYKVVKTDLYAKGHINALARQGDAKTTAHYNSFERSYTARLQAEVEKELVAAGFNAQKCRTFSNSSSKGKVGADLDMGVVEPPRYSFDASGKRIPNPAHTAWRRSLTIREPDGTLRRSSPQELQKAGQEILERSFAKIYGRSPGEAMVEFTTSYHPEAYRDLAWLGSKGTKTALVFETNKAWVQQAADVSGFKVNKLPVDHPQLGYYGVMQEQMRGLTKDFNTKIAPMLKLKAGANPEATRHLYEIRDTMDKFAKNEIGPIEAEHRIRELTGGKGMAEVAEQLSVAMRGLRNSQSTSRGY